MLSGDPPQRLLVSWKQFSGKTMASGKTVDHMAPEHRMNISLIVGFSNKNTSAHSHKTLLFQPGLLRFV